MSGPQLRGYLSKKFALTSDQSIAHIEETTGRKVKWNDEHSLEEVKKVDDAAQEKFEHDIEARRAAKEALFKQQREATAREEAAAQKEKDDAAKDEREDWQKQSAQHLVRGDKDAADYAKWRADNAGSFDKRSPNFSERELGHPQNTAASRASEIAIRYGGSGQSYFQPVHELVKPSGEPTQEFWSKWRESGFTGATGKKDLVSAGMIPEKRAEGWRINFKKS